MSAGDHTQAIATLELFNEKVTTLEQRSFMQTMLTQRTRIKVSAGPGRPPTAEREGPTEEQIAAAVLTYRSFLQKGEPYSLPKMAALYSSLPLPSDLVQRFLTVRQEVKQFLDEPLTPIAMEVEGLRVTREVIRDTLINGHYAHAEAPKKARYDRWKQIAFLPVAEAFFCETMVNIFLALRHMREINQAAIDVLRERQRAAD